MITISKGKKKRKLQKQEEHRQKKKKPASYFKGPKIKKDDDSYDGFPQQQTRTETPVQRTTLFPWDYHPQTTIEEPKQPKIIRPWKPSEKYRLGFPNDVVLNMVIEDVRRVRGEYEGFRGAMPVGYDVLVVCPEGESYNGTGPIIITNFERADDISRLDYKNIEWHLQYHAKTVTPDEMRKSKEYQEATQSFLEKAISIIEKSLKRIEKTTDRYQNPPGYQPNLRKVMFYYESIKGIEEIKNPLNIPTHLSLAVFNILSEYRHVNRDFEPRLKV